MSLSLVSFVCCVSASIMRPCPGPLRLSRLEGWGDIEGFQQVSKFRIRAIYARTCDDVGWPNQAAYSRM
jgi:hypothetical protein